MSAKPLPSAPPPSPLKWYRFFWPWFIVVLLGTTVVSGIWTAIIAFQNADPLVRDDYYREGVAINRRLSGEKLARRLGVHATLRIVGESVSVEIDSGGPDQLEGVLLQLSHATLQQRDREVLLRRGDFGSFEGVVAGLSTGRFYATLRPDGAGTDPWRLARAIALPASGEFEFSPR